MGNLRLGVLVVAVDDGDDKVGDAGEGDEDDGAREQGAHGGDRGLWRRGEGASRSRSRTWGRWRGWTVVGREPRKEPGTSFDCRIGGGERKGAHKAPIRYRDSSVWTSVYGTGRSRDALPSVSAGWGLVLVGATICSSSV